MNFSMMEKCSKKIQQKCEKQGKKNPISMISSKKVTLQYVLCKSFSLDFS